MLSDEISKNDRNKKGTDEIFSSYEKSILGVLGTSNLASEPQDYLPDLKNGFRHLVVATRAAARELN